MATPEDRMRMAKENLAKTYDKFLPKDTYDKFLPKEAEIIEDFGNGWILFIIPSLIYGVDFNQFLFHSWEDSAGEHHESIIKHF